MIQFWFHKHLDFFIDFVNFKVEQLRQEKLEIDQQLRSAVRTQYQHTGSQSFEVKILEYNERIKNDNTRVQN